MNPNIIIETVHVEAKLRKLNSKWTCEEWNPPNPMRWYHRLWAWSHNLFGYASPYDTVFHGLDVEEELIAALTDEINND